MAAYIVDKGETRSPESGDIRQLAELFGETDLLTNLQSSFNICSRVKRNDIAKRAEIECRAIDDMIAGANGKLILPTLRSDAAYDKLKEYQDQGHRVGAALSITSTYLSVSEEMADPFLATVQRGLPYIMNSMPIGGLTAPYSMTPLATFAQAEALFGLVLGQLITPGIKALNGAMPTIADMTSKAMPMMFGTVSNTMLNILLAELNMWLGIPTCQSSCSHQRDNLDEEAEQQCRLIFNLIRQYDFQIIRHIFGFSAQLNDFSLENMKRQIEIYTEVLENPTDIDLPDTPEYDSEGINVIFEGVEKRDFRTLDHTLRNVGRSFTR